MATWLEFPYECSPRELEVVRTVFFFSNDLCTVIYDKKNAGPCTKLYYYSKSKLLDPNIS